MRDSHDSNSRTRSYKAQVIVCFTKTKPDHDLGMTLGVLAYKTARTVSESSIRCRPIPSFSMIHAEKWETLKSWKWAWGRSYTMHCHTSKAAPAAPSMPS